MRRVTLPFSEAATSMRIADHTMWAEETSDGYAVQLFTDDLEPFSFPITKGEAGWHEHSYSPAAGDWLCRQCATATDSCVQVNR